MDRIRLIPESTSDILRATDIVEVRIETATASEWRRVSSRLRQRDLELTVAVLEIYKGDSEPQPGAVAPVHTIQSAPAIPRFFALPGVWSNYEPAPGDLFVIFSIAGTPIRVEPMSSAVPDVMRVLRVGAPELSIGATVAVSEGDLENWGFLFAQYLEARLPEVFDDSPGDFQSFLKAVEDQRLPVVVRSILLSAAYTKMMLYDPAPPAFIAELLATTARLLAAPEGAPLREPVLETYLPNLLGITGGLERKQPEDIFGALPAKRATIERFLSGLNIARISEWL